MVTASTHSTANTTALPALSPRRRTARHRAVSQEKPRSASYPRHRTTAANPTASTHSSTTPSGSSASAWKAPDWSVRSPESPNATWTASNAISTCVTPYAPIPIRAPTRTGVLSATSSVLVTGRP